MMEPIKEQMIDYWKQRVEGFSDQRLRELHDDIHSRWLREFAELLPQGKPLKILDVGTGTGFFCFLLEPLGYEMTGIDLTEQMVEEAGRVAEKLGSSAVFQVMDAETPDFEPESFDAIVTRNLTWTLPHLPEAYKSWWKLLKKGGILINFDADYNHEKPVDLPHFHAHELIAPELFSQYEALKDSLRPTQQLRPAWDEVLLRNAGFEQIRMDESVWQRIYIEEDEFYNPTPIFRLSAVKN